MFEDAPRKICARCTLALDIHLSAFGVSWVHTAADSPAGHDAVPVDPPPGWRGKCDFCGTGRPTHILPANDFRVPGSDTHTTGGNWAACQTCRELIEADNWLGLEARFAGEFRKRHGFAMARPARQHLRLLYRRLHDNVTGALRPIADTDTTTDENTEGT